MVFLFVFMHTNHSSHRVAGHGCRRGVSLLSSAGWVKRSRGAVFCRSSNVQGVARRLGVGRGGSKVEPQRFWGWKVSRCGELNGAEPQQIKAAAPTLWQVGLKHHKYYVPCWISGRWKWRGGIQQPRRSAGVIGQSEPISSSPTDNIFQDFTPCQRIRTAPAPLFANCLTLNIHNLYAYTFCFYFQQPLDSCCQWTSSCSQMLVKSQTKYKGVIHFSVRFLKGPIKWLTSVFSSNYIKCVRVSELPEMTKFILHSTVHKKNMWL